MYYYNEIFYSEVSNIIEDWDFDEMSDIETLKVENCTEEPIHKLTPELISQLIADYDEERYSEDNYEEEREIVSKVISENIDFDKINAQMPTLWYPNNTFETYSKAQLLSFLE